MQTQHRSIGFYTVILLLTFSSVVLLFLSLLLPKSAPSTTSPASADLSQYTAKSVGNQVVIYQTGSSEPIMLTGIDIRTLPDADRQALASGIALRNATELAHLLEDYDA